MLFELYCDDVCRRVLSHNIRATNISAAILQYCLVAGRTQARLTVDVDCRNIVFVVIVSLFRQMPGLHSTSSRSTTDAFHILATEFVALIVLSSSVPR